ncbi:MAG TPA: hypothetical protein VFU12_11720 [Glycomyces sp.]|nr:hypothetical protein [Glycomyces sp.]
MTVPPNYSMPPERPTPGYGYQPQYGGPSRPEEPKPRNYALIGAIIVGCTVIALGSILLITLGLNKGGDDKDIAGDDTSSSAEEDPTTPEDEETSPEVEETTPIADDGEVGKCLPYEPVIAGDGLELLSSCDGADAFWEITNQTYDIDAPVDSEGNLLDNQVAYDLCGDTYGTSYLGELWTNWHWVYSAGSTDSLYCIKAIGNPDAEGRLPYTPGDGDCFDDSDKWWTVSCTSDLAVYEVVGTVEFDEPKDLDDAEAASEATCGGAYYWEVTNVEGLTTAILCGNEL